MVINRELTTKTKNYDGKSKTKLKKSRVPYDMVNKIRKELHYKLKINSDPDGLTTFTSTVKIDTNVYTGKGLTKSTSRIQTMMSALSNICKINCNFINYKDNMTYNLYIINSRLYFNAGRITTDESNVKTYSAIVYFNGKKYLGKGSTMAIAKLYAAAALLSNPRDVYIERIPFLKTAKNIKPRTSNGLANKLLSIRENLNFRVLQTPHSKNSSHYVVSVMIDGKKFIGKSDTMEMARIKSITVAFNKLKYLQYKDLKKPENAQAFVLYQLRIQFYYNYIIPKRTKLGKINTAFIFIYGQTYVGRGCSRLIARIRATAAALSNSNNRISDVVFDSLQYNIYYDHKSFKSTISKTINNSLHSVQKELNFKLIKKCIKHKKSNQILYQISVQIDGIEMTGEGVGFEKAKINAIVNALKHIDNRKKPLETATPRNDISSIIHLIRNDLIYNTKSYKDSFESILFVTTVKIKNKIFIGYNLNKETSKLYAAAATICDIIAPEKTIRFNNNQGRQLKKVFKRKSNEKPMEIVEITDDDVDKDAINKNHLLFTENTGSTSYKLISLFECIENLQKSIEIMKLPNSIIDYDRPKIKLDENEAVIEVNNERYIGKGETEEEAKKIATLNAIKYLFSNISNEIIEIAKTNIIENAQKEIPNTNPITLLSELNENVKYEIYLPALAENQQWKIIANVNGQIFEGKGNESKLAKQAAAKSALAKLYNISYSPMRMLQLDDKIKYSDYELSQSLADHIGTLVIDKFESLTFTVELFNRRKVLAGIVMTENLNENSAKVIAITTGSKIVNDYSNSNDNTIIYDLHAEILSRRCLIRFLYDQLELFFKSSGNESIFEKSLNNKLLKLKDGIDFHLYISTAPCGDACGYFTKHSVTEIESLHKHIKGKLQMKIELGDGAIPLDDDFKQENQLAIMSCSDKIAKWNVVGIQGALLSTVIKPIYLKSIVLGNVLNPIDMYRSNCGRFENLIGKLPQFYHLNKPKYALLTSTEIVSTIHSPDFAINWYIGCKLIEIINTSNGKVIKSNHPSHLTQFELFEKYQKLIKHNQIYFKNIEIKRNYRKMKESAMDYQIAKNALYSAFVGIGLGEWVKKVY